MSETAKYNLFTNQMGREPLWKPFEVLKYLESAQAGELLVMDEDRHRIYQFVENRHDQLIQLSITETNVISMFAATLLLCNKEFPSFTEYAEYVQEHIDGGYWYMKPREWAEKHK